MLMGTGTYIGRTGNDISKYIYGILNTQDTIDETILARFKSSDGTYKFTCNNTQPHCIRKSFYKPNPTQEQYTIQQTSFFKPARLVAQDLLMHDTDNPDQSTLADIQSAYAGFEQVVDEFGEI